VAECEKSSETAYFWYRTTLDAAPDIDNNGGLKWWIVILLLFAWVIVFFIVMKGIQSSGKVTIFFVTTVQPILKADTVLIYFNVFFAQET
jgi:solute carrier family 6 amino acid/orphan transporter-like 15/16/17/18/20